MHINSSNLSVALNPTRVLGSFFPKQIRESINNQPKKDWIVEKIEENSYPAQYFQFEIQDILITARIRHFPKSGVGLYEVFIAAEIPNKAEWDWKVCGTDKSIKDLFIHVAQQYMQNIKDRGLA